MKATAGRSASGPAGTAVEIVATLEAGDPPALQGTVASWFLTCPGQSPAWSHYVASVIHLRPIDGAPPAVVNIPHATHEVVVAALDPALRPEPTVPASWRWLFPVNVCEQVQLPDDRAADELLERAVAAVVDGVLPAEPALAGAVEPWRTALIKTSAHLRGEEHAP